MKILPTLAEVKKLASDAKYNVLPVSYEMLSDFTTPIETMKILKNVSTHCYMLESAQANETWGRYTFLGFDPKLEITCMDGEMKIGNFKVKTENPSDYLRQILADYKSPRFDYLPSFTGGLVVVANIVADVVILLTKDAPRFMKPDTVYIMSGIIDTREDDVLACLADKFEINCNKIMLTQSRTQSFQVFGTVYYLHSFVPIVFIKRKNSNICLKLF